MTVAVDSDSQLLALIKSRVAGHGSQQSDLVFHAQTYVDLLVCDLGLHVYRRKGFMAELFGEPSQPKLVVTETRLYKTVLH